MKKILSVLLCFVLLSTFFVVAFAEEEEFNYPVDAIIDPGGAVLYVSDEKAGKESEIKIPEFSQIKVLSKSYFENEKKTLVKYKVSYKDITGYIIVDSDTYGRDNMLPETYNRFSEVYTPFTEKEHIYETSKFSFKSCADSKRKYAKVKYKDGINIRKGPNTAYNVIEKIPSGTYIQYDEDEVVCGWALIGNAYSAEKYEEKDYYGWIYIGGLTEIKDFKIPEETENEEIITEKTSVEQTTYIQTQEAEDSGSFVYEETTESFTKSEIALICVVIAFFTLIIFFTVVFVVKMINKKVKKSKEKS